MMRMIRSGNPFGLGDGDGGLGDGDGDGGSGLGDDGTGLGDGDGGLSDGGGNLAAGDGGGNLVAGDGGGNLAAGDGGGNLVAGDGGGNLVAAKGGGGGGSGGLRRTGYTFDANAPIMLPGGENSMTTYTVFPFIATPAPAEVVCRHTSCVKWPVLEENADDT